MDQKTANALSEQIKDLGESLVDQQTKAEGKLQKSLNEKLEGVKVELTKSVNDVKGELSIEIKSAKDVAEKASESLKTVEADASAAKGLAQSIELKFDEMDKKLNTSKTFGADGQKGESFADALKKAVDENHDEIKKIAIKDNGRQRQLSIEIKAAGDVTIGGNYTGGTRGLQVMRPGIIEQPKRKVHIRQLLPSGQVGQGTEYVFMRENGNGEGSIAATAEGADKPQFDVDLIEASVKIETIAGWMKVTRKAMNNIPGFISFLQSKLPEKLLKVEDAQILYGSGVTPNLKGILTTGNFVPSTSTAATTVERLIDDIALLEDTHERSATGILMRPVDYYGFFKNKASGSGEYDLPDNVYFVNGVLYISGVPVFASTALGVSDVDPGAGVSNKNDYIVGDWEQGAQLLTQEGLRLEFFEQDDKNVQQNKITVRIEETVALPVYGNNYFVKGNVA